MWEADELHPSQDQVPLVRGRYTVTLSYQAPAKPPAQSSEAEAKHCFLGTHSLARGEKYEQADDLTMAVTFFYQRAKQIFLDSFGDLEIYCSSRVPGIICL